MIKTALSTSSVAILTLAMGTSAAYAQTPSGFDEIIVTAQKTEQSLQDVPVSVLAVSGTELVDRNINEFTQLTLAAPTLQVGQDNNFSIRGIGTQTPVETVDPSVALAVDGVSLGRNVLAGAPFNDVASVEVLNGPQGLLFGKNASAGLINVTTKRPVLGEFEGFAGVEYLVRDTTPDNATGIVTRGTLNIPVGDKSALRINGLYSDQESLIENIFPNPDTVRVDLDQERWGVKAKFLYENGPFSAYLIGDYNENSGAGGRLSRTFRSVEPGDDRVFQSIVADNITPGPENFTNASDGTQFRDVDIGGAQATLSYAFENGFELINIAAWRFFDSDQNIHSDFNSSLDIINNPNSNDYNQFSNELRLVLPKNDKLNGQVGLFFFQSDSNIIDSISIQGPFPFTNSNFPFCIGAEVTPGPPPNCPVSNNSFLGSSSDTDLDVTSYAAFGQFDYNITDRLTATAGARLTIDDVSSTVEQGQIPVFINIGGTPGTFSESVDNTNFSWKLGAQYELSDNAMIYASAGQGYKAPGFNTDFLALAEVPFAVEDEISTTFEAGLRSQLADNRLIFNVSLFYTDFENYQIQSFNNPTNGFIIQNAADVTSFGAELSVAAKLSENFTLTWDAALLDAEFDEFLEAPCVPDNPLCVPGSDFFDASGQSTPISADFTSTIQAVYEDDITDTMSGFVQASLYSRSDINFGIGSPAQRLGSINTINFSTGIKMDNGFRVSVFCKNCTDEVTPSSIAFDPGSSNRGVANVQQTFGLDSVRSIGATTSYEF